MVDPAWWGEHRNVLVERWNAWLLRVSATYLRVRAGLRT